MAIFEITAAGFDGSDATSERVMWIRAATREEVETCIVDCDATLVREVEAGEMQATDYTLPGQRLNLQSKLLYWIGVERNAPRGLETDAPDEDDDAEPIDEHFSFTLHGNIDDAMELRAKAIAMRLKDFPDDTEAEIEEMFGTVAAPELTACIRYVLDNVPHDLGLSINDSDCETY